MNQMTNIDVTMLSPEVQEMQKILNKMIEDEVNGSKTTAKSVLGELYDLSEADFSENEDFGVEELQDLVGQKTCLLADILGLETMD